MPSLASRLSGRIQRDYTPVSWTEYFDEAHDIHLPANRLADTDEQEAADSFRVYLKNFQEPFSPRRDPGERLQPNKVELSAAEIDQHAAVPTLVALHGGGYSGLTWAEFAKHIDQQCRSRIMAIDLRGHGDTKTVDEYKMDADTLVSDVVTVIREAHQICGFTETPKLVLIGHSMGGAIAVKCATKCTELLPSLAGFVIIDVVEGTAKDALPQMMSVIKTRPTKFSSLSHAIEWSVRSGMAKNCNAARVSMPSNLVNVANGQLAIHDVPIDSKMDEEQRNRNSRMLERIHRHKFNISLDQLIGSSPPHVPLPRLPLPPRISALKGGEFSVPQVSSLSSPTTSPKLPSKGGSAISEDEETTEDLSSFDDTKRERVAKQDSGENLDNEGYKKPPDIDSSGYTWRTNLAKTQPHWNGWFDGLSAQLLSAPVQGKFLLLAGIDRLDKTLTIGHMQGKFMMKVLPKCGHAVHEDVPEQVASVIGDFLVRNKFAEAYHTAATD